MENFHVEDKFYIELEDLFHDLDYDEENHPSDDWTLKVELSDLEPIFNIDAEKLCQMLADCNEERLTEHEDEEQKVLNAIKESVDFDKLRALLPKYYYPNGEFKTLTKQDFLNTI
jgi:hypothetical protein